MTDVSSKSLTVPRLTWLLVAAALTLTLNAAAINFPLYVLLSLTKALVLVFIIFIYGYLALRLVYHKRKEAPIEFTAAFAMGLIVTALFFYLVSLLKVLYPWVIVLYLLAPLLGVGAPNLFTVSQMPFFRSFISKVCRKGVAPPTNSRSARCRLFGDVISKKNKVSQGNSKKKEPGLPHTLTAFFKRPLVEYLVFLFPLIYVLLPSSFYDTLAYHLGIPNLYLQNSGFIGTPQLFYANTFIYYEISLIPAVFLGDLVPRLFHFFMGMIFILSVLDFAVDYFKITKRTILLLTIISMPMMVFLLTTVKNDLPSGLFIFLGVRCLLKGRVTHDNESSPGDNEIKKNSVSSVTSVAKNNLMAGLSEKYYLSALFWGFALGVKYTNIIPLVLFLILYHIKEKRIPIKHMLIFGIIIVCILLPLLGKNYTDTGNPLFPFFHKYFNNKLPYWDTTRLTLLEKEAQKIFYSIKDVLKFPYTLSFKELGSGGIVGPLFLIFLPFLVVKREKRLLLLIFSLLVLLVGGYFKLSIRIWVIAFIFLSIYVAIAYEFINYKIMKYLFFIIIGFNVVTGFGLQEFLNRSFNFYTGRQGIEEYKASAFDTYKAIAFVNKNAPGHSRVLLVGEAKSYYLKRPYYVSSAYDFSILKKYLDKRSGFNDFITALKADGIDIIIFNSGQFHRQQQAYNRLTREEFNRSLDFFKRLKPVFQEQGIFVFVINSPPPV